MTLPPDDDPGARHARARRALETGDTAAGIAELERYLAAEPDDGTAWLELGLAHGALDRHAEAASALARAVELDGAVVEARLAYGRALVRTGKLDDAAYQLLQAQRLAPEDARVLSELGSVYYDKRLYDRAVQWFGRARAAAPEDPRTCFALGLVHEARRDPGAALAAYREAIRLDPAFVGARRALIDTLASLGEHERALEETDALLQIDRANEQAAQNREVLERALREMRARRLLGREERALEESALVQRGGMKRRGRLLAEGDVETVRYAEPLSEVLVTLRAGRITALLLVLLDPEKAARRRDEDYRVTVVGEDGRRVPADSATAITLAFLHEALGMPMTQASQVYARLLAGERDVEWGGALVRFASVERPEKPGRERHGLLAALVARGETSD